MALFEELEDELTTRLVRAFYTTPMYDTHPKREGRPRSEYYAVLLKWLGDSDFREADFVQAGLDRVDPARHQHYIDLYYWGRENLSHFGPIHDLAEDFRRELASAGKGTPDFPKLLTENKPAECLKSLWKTIFANLYRTGPESLRETKENMRRFENLLVSERLLSRSQVNKISAPYWGKIKEPKRVEKARQVAAEAKLRPIQVAAPDAADAKPWRRFLKHLKR